MHIIEFQLNSYFQLEIEIKYMITHQLTTCPYKKKLSIVPLKKLHFLQVSNIAHCFLKFGHTVHCLHIFNKVFSSFYVFNTDFCCPSKRIQSMCFQVFGSALDQADMHGETPYNIMFGPDICGPGTKKVHVIFSYKGKNLLVKKDIRCKVIT